jgi:hypothetical protein
MCPTWRSVAEGFGKDLSAERARRSDASPQIGLRIVRPSDDAQNESLRVVLCLIPAAACSSRQKAVAPACRLRSHGVLLPST